MLIAELLPQGGGSTIVPVTVSNVKQPHLEVEIVYASPSKSSQIKLEDASPAKNSKRIVHKRIK